MNSKVTENLILILFIAATSITFGLDQNNGKNKHKKGQVI